MLNWAMTVWNMPASEFVWAFLKWFVVIWVYYQVHQEVNLWRTRRLLRIQRLGR